MPLHAEAWQEALRTFGLKGSTRKIYEWEGEPGTVTARTFLRQTQRKPSRQAVAALLAEKERRFQWLARRIKVHPRLERLLTRCSRWGLRLGLVTGTSFQEVSRIVPAHILAKFDAIITGDCVRRGKPNPEPYRTAFRKLRAAAHQGIVVENAPYGIRSARAAGAGTVIALASSLPARFLREAHWVVPSISKLCGVLERLTGRD